MHKLLKLAVILTIATSLTTGCANLATSSISPSTKLSTLKTMYVKHYPSDNSGVNLEIADKLRSKGVTVLTGPETLPSNIDALVTYVDKWRWDITMYMLELTITIRDPKTETILATGKSLHTSLTRKSQTEMVDEVVNNIYKDPNNAITANLFKNPPSQAARTNVNSPQVALPNPANKESDAPTQMQTNFSQKLEDLKFLRKNGTITEDEYTSKRKQLIDKF